MSNPGEFVIKNKVLKSYEGVSEEVVIPEGIEEIAQNAFVKRSHIKTVVIPEGVVKIGRWAFGECKELEKVSLPNSLKQISYGAFERCEKLCEISIPEGVCIIDDYAFCACPSIKEITIPENITKIKRGAFRWCGSIKLSFPKNLSFIDDFAFSGSRFSYFEIPEGVEEIGKNAFYYCYKLESIVIPESVKKIGDYAFLSCYNLKNVVIKNTDIKIGKSAFKDCRALENVEFPSGSLDIGKQAFEGCENLRNECGYVRHSDPEIIKHLFGEYYPYLILNEIIDRTCPAWEKCCESMKRQKERLADTIIYSGDVKRLKVFLSALNKISEKDMEKLIELSVEYSKPEVTATLLEFKNEKHEFNNKDFKI